MAGIKRLPGETDSEYWNRVNEVIDGLDYVHTRNGQVLARYPSKYRVVPNAVDALTGILSADYDLDEVKMERLREKYALTN
ncbi:MAG: hypothetical protein IJT58_07935 [Synergistaceae bacterium]|nr:hypothetical protein [Synergistaceae bacterium]